MNKLNIVIFGVTSNLAEVKLIPALFELWNNKQIPENIAIIGLFNRNRTQKELRNLIGKSLQLKGGEVGEKLIERFWKKFKFLNGDLRDDLIYKNLKKELRKNSGDIIFYLATHPALYKDILSNLDKEKFNKNSKGSIKIMIEKPIGYDLKSAKSLNKLFKKYFSEKQIFRIDHYLAKDTIQNILTFRFHNEVFESVWNRKKVDHIQITAAESFGAELRNAYYDSVGALRDVGQNHVLQMLAFTVMDRPARFDNEGITSKRMDVFENLVAKPNSLVLGQYENYSSKKIDVETFFAFKTRLRRGKFCGVPIYIRGGKKLAKTVAEISVVFNKKDNEQANVLIFRIQPNEGIVFEMAVKKPGLDIKCEKGTMQFCYRQIGKLNNPYARLLMDAILGEQTYFNDAEEIEAEWKFIDALKSMKTKIFPYSAGTWGPKKADELMKKDGREWLEPSDELCRI